MMRVLLAAVATSLAAFAVVALAQPTTAAELPFGHHVATCAQGHGFDGTHNPGMHHRHGVDHNMHCLR